MTEQCMHDGKAGPCERPAAPAEHFCRRHLPKRAAKKTPVGFDTEPLGRSSESIAPETKPVSVFGGWHRGLAPDVAWRSSCYGLEIVLPRRRPLVPVEQLGLEALPLGPVVEGVDGEPRPLE